MIAVPTTQTAPVSLSLFSLFFEYFHQNTFADKIKAVLFSFNTMTDSGNDFFHFCVMSIEEIRDRVGFHNNALCAKVELSFSSSSDKNQPISSNFVGPFG